MKLVYNTLLKKIDSTACRSNIRSMFYIYMYVSMLGFVKKYIEFASVLASFYSSVSKIRSAITPQSTSNLSTMILMFWGGVL